MWSGLRGDQLAGVNFRRQHAIGKYVVDFCSPNNKLVIEVDGGQHTELEEYDQLRTEYLESKGFKVLRFWNHEVISDINRVLRAIDDSIREDH